MRSEQRTLIVPIEATAVYDFMIDYTHDRLWREELVEVHLASGELGVPGAEYDTLSNWNGLQSRSRIQLVDCDRPSRIHFRLEEPAATIDSVYRLEPHGNSTDLLVEFTLDSKGGLILVEPFSWAILTRWADGALPKLADAIATWDRQHERNSL